MATTIIFNACIITMNERMELIKNGSIRIEGNQIKEIRKDKIESPDAEYFDAEGMIVMPGFINTHTHVPMTMLRGYADDLPLHTWLNEHIFPAEARMVTPENVAIASRFAFIEMIKSGTTCFNDMYFFEDIIASEAKKAGIRAVVGESLIDFPTIPRSTMVRGQLDPSCHLCPFTLYLFKRDTTKSQSSLRKIQYSSPHPRGRNP